MVGIECIRNTLGEVDASGRRRPVPTPGSEFSISLNTLIVAIGERPDSDYLTSMGLEVHKSGRVPADRRTLQTNREGVFAGGDLITGPNTVAEAIAAGKKAASVIDRYLRGDALVGNPEIKLPDVFVEPAEVTEDERDVSHGAEPATIPVESRKKNFAEVEMALSVEQAHAETRRCLRCDLTFTQPQENKHNSEAVERTTT